MCVFTLMKKDQYEKKSNRIENFVRHFSFINLAAKFTLIINREKEFFLLFWVQFNFWLDDKCYNWTIIIIIIGTHFWWNRIVPNVIRSISYDRLLVINHNNIMKTMMLVNNLNFMHWFFETFIELPSLNISNNQMESLLSTIYYG